MPMETRSTRHSTVMENREEEPRHAQIYHEQPPRSPSAAAAAPPPIQTDGVPRLVVIQEELPQVQQKSKAGSSSHSSTRALRLARAQEEVARAKLDLAVAQAKVVEAEDDDEELQSVISSKKSVTGQRVGAWVDSTVRFAPPTGAPAAPHGNTTQQTAQRDIAYHTEMQPPQPTRPMEGRTPTTVQNTVDLSELAAAITTAARSGNQPRLSNYYGDLPIFNGSHHEWLAFKSAYVETHTYFTTVENTARLRKSLRGRAREAVNCLLIANATADEIIDTLENRFGRPDAIAIAELEKLRSIPRPTDSPKDICLFANKIKNSVATLRVLNRMYYLFNPEVVRIIIEKLPSTIRYRWYDYADEDGTNLPDLVKFSNFLDREARRCGRFAPPEQISSDQPRTAYRDRPQQTFATDNRTDQQRDRSPTCLVCSKTGHTAVNCEKFTNADNDGRWGLAKQHRLCFRCLRYKTSVHRCPMKTCDEDGCQRSHHPMLHHVRTMDTAVASLSHPPEKKRETVASSLSRNDSRPYLKIIPVRVAGPHGYVDTHALLDDGSTVTLVDADTASRVGAEGPIDPLCIEAIAGATVNHRASRRVTLRIQGQGEEYELKARTIDQLKLSPQAVEERNLKNYRHLSEVIGQLTYHSARPTVLIGQDNWHLLIAREIRRGPINQPVASLTPLGWVLHGSTNRSLGSCVHYVNHLTTEEDRMEEIVRRHFAIESLGVQPKSPRSDPEERAMKILQNSTIERPSGGYETALLWKQDSITLPNNYDSALKRLHSTEKQLDRNQPLKTNYEKQIEELVSKGYAEKVTTPATPGKTWYLPHFAVTHPAKPGKVRPVFDAAARSQGTALNDNLLSGPDLLQSLPGVLMRFRQHRIAVSADIQEMFLRIGIREEDRDALRFLWRRDRREGPPQEYRMKVVIFGAACSPCTALYVKNFNAEKHREQYPEAAEAVVVHHYVDDYLQSFRSIEEAKKISTEVREIHKKANFHLRKWTSNRTELTELHQDSPVATEEVQLNDGFKEEKILGMTWRPAADTLCFNLNFSRVSAHIISGQRTPTKREALQTVMSLFDPLGLVSPVTIQAKRILQETWRAGTAWDDPIPAPLDVTWKKWIEDLKQLKNLNIPRCYPELSDATTREIHTFVDASETAWVAAVYWRTVSSEGQVHVTLAAAKARVAPLKITSIPRLELQAAVLGCRLAKTVIEEHQVKPDRKYYWSDSKTVLAWLRAGPRSFKPFVAHRVAEIEEETTVNEWRWVPTHLNVADDATRNVPPGYSQEHRWFVGPQFLYENSDSWPTEKTEKIENTGEERVHTVRQTSSPLIEALPNIDRFSSWLRLIRVTARVLQAVDMFKRTQKDDVNYKRTRRNHEADPAWKNEKPKKNTITPRRAQTEMEDTKIRSLPAYYMKRAEELWVRAGQQQSFPTEIAALQKNDTLARDSRLRQIAVTLDENSIIRLKSRIAATADITQEQREPAVLDGDHQFTRLYIAWTHRQLMHSGTEMVINEVRQHYWVIRLRPTTKTVVKSCIECRIRKARPTEPATGDHPRSRVAHHLRPFTYSGLDYFGPLSVTVGRQHHKRYVALFTCLTTRAVHLEVAYSLTADSAVLALRRMIARRGTPTEIYSDNGTNFHAADKELKTAIRAIEGEASKRAITWKYLPAAAPFMGGAWERLVRSVKSALYNVLHDRHPHEEVLSTLLCEAEYTVNSRPLTHVSTETEDDEALTPNHFLIGGSGRVTVPGTFADSDLDCRQHWRRAQRLADLFWKKWLLEYLPELQNRREPYGRGEALRVGDLVFIVDTTLPRNTWPRGKVIQVYPGPDGIIRVADIQTKGGILRRPTKRLVVIPAGDSTTVPAVVETPATSAAPSPPLHGGSMCPTTTET